jgi:hypothetical protein
MGFVGYEKRCGASLCQADEDTGRNAIGVVLKY